MPLSELSQITVGQTILGVFWSVWFAQLSLAAVRAESATRVPTDLSRTLYVLVATFAVLLLTVLFWFLQGAVQALCGVTAVEQTRAAVRALTMRLLATILLSFCLVSAVVAGLPLGAYALFEGLSLHEALLSAVIIPTWLGFVIALTLVSIAKQQEVG